MIFKYCIFRLKSFFQRAFYNFENKNRMQVICKNITRSTENYLETKI